MDAGRTLRIWMIDDSATVRALSSHHARKAGAEVTEFDSPTAALVAMSADPRAAPDAIIVDNDMPGINGPELALVMRFRGYRGCILLMTATLTPALASAATRAGADGAMEKSGDVNTLRLVIAALSRRRASRAAA